MLRYKNYWENSYTKYSNEIGLTSEGKYLNYNTDVVLDFPHKDSVLEGGMTKEDQGKKEIYYHNVLAKEEIDTLLSPKVLTNIKKYDKNGEHDIDNLKGFLNDTSSFGFIAKENNKIIGFAYCYTLLRPDGKTMFYLHSIGMLPNYQDKGYGSKLLSFIKEYSKEIGCSEMFLITDKGNPRACHVYEKLGGKNDYKDEIVYVYDYEKGDK